MQNNFHFVKKHITASLPVFPNFMLAFPLSLRHIPLVLICCFTASVVVLLPALLSLVHFPPLTSQYMKGHIFFDHISNKKLQKICQKYRGGCIFHVFVSHIICMSSFFMYPCIRANKLTHVGLVLSYFFDY